MADPTKFNFSRTDASRIAKATRAYESQTLTDAPAAPPARGPQWIMILIDSPADGRETYNAKLLQPNTSDRDEGADASADDFGTPYTPTSDSIKYLAINGLGIGVGSNTHCLPGGSPWPAIILRRQKDGTIVCGVWGFGTKLCTPQDFGDGDDDGDSDA